MKFRAKLTIAMVLLLSLTYGIGGSLMIAQSFSSSIDRERDAAVQTYRMVVDVLDLLGDNASPGTAANTVALVLREPLMRIYSEEPAVIEAGMMRLILRR